MKKKIITAVATATGMLLLILDGRTAMTGAAAGIELCIRSVIPSLFPFLVLSCLLTAALSDSGPGLFRPLCRLTGIPESILPVSFLGGYPVGAQSVTQLYAQGQLSREAARRLLMFCSNPGPAFLFGIVGPQFSAKAAPWMLYGIVILSAIFVAVLVPHPPSEIKRIPGKNLTLTDALTGSISVMGRICGWVVLFRILTGFLDRWILWLMPDGLSTLVTGLLELTAGCCELSSIPDEKLRFVAAAVLLSFGGLCVWLQTASVTADLGTGTYLIGKLLQCLISGLLAWLAVCGKIWIFALLLPAVMGIRILKKRDSNSSTVGV